jgi:Flp pilus assembly protein TadG
MNRLRSISGFGRAGTAAVEMALITPMLLILLTSTIDFSRVYYEEITLSAGVAAASQYALINAANVNSTNAASLAASLSGIVANSNANNWAGASVTVNDGVTNSISSGGTTTTGTVANANSCWCPTGTGGAWTWGSAATCGSACAGGTLAGKFVTVAGTRSFVAIFGNYGVIKNTTLHQNTIVQVQ